MDETMALQPGVRLQSKDRTYEIDKVLGAGSFGITYLATATVPIGNISTTIKFAIKEYFLSDSCYRGDDGITVYALPKDKSTVASSRIDFINEANRLKKICHKSRNIVSVNETFEANGTAYYVMEYLDGGNPTKCTEDEAISIVQQIADALEIIHQDGIIHMDLRPDNIVMKTTEKNGTYPVLIDFGISLYFDSKGKSETTLTIKGASPGYAPPEQVSRKCKFSPQYDIYALGAVLFYLCTGKTPPKGSDISQDQTQLREVLDGRVSTNIETAILNAMLPDAQYRTPSIQKFRDDLMGIVFQPRLEVRETLIDFTKEKSEQTVEVDTNIDWTVYADGDWCSVSKTDDSISISVSKNHDGSPRSCNVFVNGLTENVSHLINVRQAGTGTVIFRDEDSWWDINSRKAYAAVSVLAIIGCIYGLYVWVKPTLSSATDSIADATSTSSSDTIDSQEHDINIDRDPVKSDPDKQVITPTPDNHNEEKEPEKHDIPVEETNDAKFARASKTNDNALMLSLAQADYAKAYYPVALNYYNKGNKDQAKSWANKAIAANVNRTQAQALLDKLTPPSPPTPTDDELFAKAKTLEDYKVLADKGYAKAYAPLADKYFSNKDYANADKYVRKAYSSNSGRPQAKTVADKLEVIGFYDNGENGGKPR